MTDELELLKAFIGVSGYDIELIERPVQTTDGEVLTTIKKYNLTPKKSACILSSEEIKGFEDMYDKNKNLSVGPVFRESHDPQGSRNNYKYYLQSLKNYLAVESVQTSTLSKEFCELQSEEIKRNNNNEKINYIKKDIKISFERMEVKSNESDIRNVIAEVIRVVSFHFGVDQ